MRGASVGAELTLVLSNCQVLLCSASCQENEERTTTKFRHFWDQHTSDQSTSGGDPKRRGYFSGKETRATL